ncbi:hypothetical protein [Polyangium sp. y55x31]|uniref:hypothetical protein n=1 Tax=Polyangium sp. y55x31 TaxID=3042688 RepID=UPI0024828822|nr:hypothetical protein [Polyangium sp. y55x31]MDI1481494.1 hypothetical protein [Polyangium sp. y55x31]
MRRKKALGPLAFALVTLALCALGCDKKNPSGASPSASTEAAAPLADFPDGKPSSWIHGAPAPLAGARGQVVLVEAWHPT